MGRDTHHRLVTYLRNTADEYLRGIAMYDADEYDVLYLRDDLRARRFKSEVDRMVDRLNQESRAREQQAFPFGDLTGTLRTFEEAVVMHFPHTQGRGTIITLEPGVARQLNSFMHECEKRIEY